MKVVKFGGSSLASASQLEKVLHIVKSDAERRFSSFPHQEKEMTRIQKSPMP